MENHSHRRGQCGSAAEVISPAAQFLSRRSSINTIRLWHGGGRLSLLCRYYADDCLLARGPRAATDHALPLDSNDIRFARRKASTQATNSAPISRIRSTRSTPRAASAPKMLSVVPLPLVRPGRAALAGAIHPDYVLSPIRSGCRPASTSPRQWIKQTSCGESVEIAFAAHHPAYSVERLARETYEHSPWIAETVHDA